jgi:putative RecB family exonuclease
VGVPTRRFYRAKPLDAGARGEDSLRILAAVQQIFSHSSLSCFETCPKQYHFRYIEKIRVDLEGIEAFTGKQVHEVLERLYLFVAEGKIPSLDRVLFRYRENWEERFDPDRIRIVRSGLGPDFYRSNGERCLENYYRRHYPFDADETLGLEKRIQFPIDEQGKYRIRGVIDRLVRARDGALEIHDFKTGARVPSQANLDRDRQLALYEIGVRQQLGEESEVRLVWHYVLPNQLRTSTRTPEQLADLRTATAGIIDRIRDEQGWAPRPGRLCDWCDYKEICPAFREENEKAAQLSTEPAGEVVPTKDQLRLL